MGKNKILIGIPLHYTQEIPKELKQDLARLRGDFDVLFMRDLPEDAYRGDRIYRIAQARERIRIEFLARDYTHLLFIDSDIGFPPETLEVLLTFEGDVISHNYQSKLSETEISTGLGCTLIRREVLEKCSFTKGITVNSNYQKKKGFGEDVSFFLQVKENNFKLVQLNNVIELKHLPYDFNNLLEQWISSERTGKRLPLGSEWDEHK